MSWRSVLPLLLLAGSAAAADGYIVGVGVEADSGDGLAGSLIGEVAIGDDTWLSAALARNSVALPRIPDIATWYADVGIDHWFDPVGIRLGAAYWGDADILDSQDWRGSLYWRIGGATLAGDYEFRDFRFQLPATDRFAGRRVRFDASGIGLSSRFELTDNVSLSLSGMDYDYSVNLSLDSNRDILELLSFSRLSLINSLVDYRVQATLGLEAGERRWQFDVGSWRGEADGGITRSMTVRLLTPLSGRSDIEFGLGADDSELYGTVTFFSVFVYFYGGT